MNSPTLVCFALKEEAEAFKEMAGSWPEVRVLLTGIGKVNARRSLTEALTNARPKLVLSCGFAGGLRPGLALGTVVFSMDGQPDLRRSLELAGAIRATFHCSDHIAWTAAEKQELWKTTGADAVEMESQILCAICREQAISCATVRVISDSADEDLPLDFNRLMTPDQRLDPYKLAKALLKSPSKVAGLLRIQKQCKDAARSLANVLEKVPSLRT